MKIIKRLTGSSKMLNLSVLLILGIFTANYRTISMLRGETYILFLNSFLLYRMLILFQKSFKYEKIDVILCGITIGLLALSRQWAFLLFPAYFLIYFLIKNYEEKKFYFKFLFYIFSIGFFISSWFYFGLFLNTEHLQLLIKIQSLLIFQTNHFLFTYLTVMKFLWFSQNQ